MPRRCRVGNPTVAIGYIRVSTARQELGPAAQRTAIEAWAAAKGVTIASWHEDLGVSGSAPLEKRAGLLGAIAAIRDQEAGFLVVARRDRLARDLVVAGLTERAAVASGATIVSADGAGNGDTPGDAFMRTILDGAAVYERALIKARTKAALAEKRARGEKLGGLVPYGYSVGDDGRSLVPVSDEQAVIASVRTLRASGVSLRGIVSSLASAGVVARTGRPLGLTQVARIVA